MNASRAELANRFSPDASVAPRRIVHHVQGRQHGPIKRLVAAVLSLVLASAAAAEGADIKAPKGTYKNDPYHSSLTFKIDHMGLSHYTARFIKFDATLDLDPAKLGSSSVTVNIDPTSVRTDYSGDFKAGHKDSPYKTFDEEITRGDKFLNADKFSTITFKSTNVVQAGKTLKVTGDLTFLGVTKPVTLLGSVVGSVEKHPLLGKGVVGFSTTGTVKRSDLASPIQKAFAALKRSGTWTVIFSLAGISSGSNRAVRTFLGLADDRFGFQVLLQPEDPAFPTDPRLFEPTEGSKRIVT